MLIDTIPIRLAREADLAEEWWECGVHQGKTSCQLAEMHPRILRLFDTFTGRPPIGPEDGTQLGEGTQFTDTSLEMVRQRLPQPWVVCHAGMIPDTFMGLEQARISFAYLDLDLYRSTRDALAFVIPRLTSGGVIVVHDYGTRHWPGVSRAVDEVVWPDGYDQTVVEDCAVIRR